MSTTSNYTNASSWTNLEDQIVKAGIQKYGTRQWSKIASLLQHKNAKQCQIRWEEYLNPRLNFTEFTGQEDARLLRLARQLPNQWRTVAAAMGRTAQVCINRYNILLEGDDEFGVGSSLQLEYPNAETQAAKTDNFELQDEEREMLAEARARLLNTQGKKATRKVRERMLEESKRIAQLQKKRELKQAGEKTAIRKPRRKYETEIDYNEDVAYEQEPLPGIYDTSYEDERMARDIANFEKRISLRGIKEDRKASHNLATKRHRTDGAGPGESSGTVVEVKRPKLKLSEPGIKEDVDEVVRMNRRALLQESYSEEPSPAIRSRPRKTLAQLFASLPRPKNDFEIILDDEDEEEQDEEENKVEDDQESRRRSLETKSAAAEEEEEEQETEVTSDHVQPLQMDCLRTKAPDFIQNPANAFEQAFNHLSAAYTIGEPFMQPTDILPFMHQVERLMKDAPVHRQECQFQWQDPTKVEIKDAIDKKLHIVNGLRGGLEYLKPLIEVNTKLCQKTCIEQLPRLRKIQQEYYVNYKKYQCEMQAIETRRRRFQNDLEGSIPSASGNHYKA